MPQTMQITLLDGNQFGRIRCSLGDNITCRVYRIPRDMVDEGFGTEMQNSGIYLLLSGREPGNPEKVYIGQAVGTGNHNGVLQKLREESHSGHAGNWSIALVFTRIDNSLGAAELGFLEHQLYTSIKDAGRCVLINTDEPNRGHLSSVMRDDLNEYIEYITLMVGLLGYTMFIPSTPRGIKLVLNQKIIETNEEVMAECLWCNGCFTVLPGSYISLREKSDELSEYILYKRHSDIIDENRILTEEVSFSKPSPAAAFVIGGAAQGGMRWKTPTGITLKELMERRQ